MIESLFRIVQIDGRNAHAVAGAANSISARFVQGLCHLRDLAALGGQLDEQRNVDCFLDRLDDLGCHIGILTHASAGLLGSSLAAAGGQLQIVGHIGAAHIQLNDIRADLFKLLGHVDPAGNTGITCIGDIGHQFQVMELGLGIGNEL